MNVECSQCRSDEEMCDLNMVIIGMRCCPWCSHRAQSEDDPPRTFPQPHHDR